MPKTFELSEYLNKNQRVNRLFFIAAAVILCVGASAYIIVTTKADMEDTIPGLILLWIFFSICYSINGVFEDLLGKYKKHDTLIYTLYKDRILYNTNLDLDVIFLDGIQNVTLCLNKRELTHEIHFKMKNMGDIRCLYVTQGDFHESFKKYLNENKVSNNL